jgi:hypothetical protein
MAGLHGDCRWLPLCRKLSKVIHRSMHRRRNVQRDNGFYLSRAVAPLIGADMPLAFGHPVKRSAFVMRMGCLPFLRRSARVCGTFREPIA